MVRTGNGEVACDILESDRLFIAGGLTCGGPLLGPLRRFPSDPCCFLIGGEVVEGEVLVRVVAGSLDFVASLGLSNVGSFSGSLDCECHGKPCCAMSQAANRRRALRLGSRAPAAVSEAIHSIRFSQQTPAM